MWEEGRLQGWKNKEASKCKIQDIPIIFSVMTRHSNEKTY